MKLIELFLIISLMSFCTSLAMIMFKLATKNFPKNNSVINFAKFFLSWRIIAGITLYVLATVIFFIILRTEELSYAYSLTSITYVFVTVFSYLLLKEKINMKKIIAVSLIILGIVVISL